jgi:hypothetical protein
MTTPSATSAPGLERGHQVDAQDLRAAVRLRAPVSPLGLTRRTSAPPELRATSTLATSARAKHLVTLGLYAPGPSAPPERRALRCVTSVRL